MLKKPLITLLIIGFSIVSYAQQIKLNGNYNGKNLYIINPSVTQDMVFCIDSITVNGKRTSDEINSNSFEIDLASLKINIGSSVEIIIFHKEGCIPKIVNQMAISQKNNFQFLPIKADKNGKLTWSIKGNPGAAPFMIEQFRWKKWVEVGEILPTDSIGKNQYSFETKMQHFGFNSFRIKQTDTYDNAVYSKDIKFRSQKTETFLESSKASAEIKFSAETLFEIYDDKGNFVMKGFGASANTSSLIKGKYWINYDNKTENFTKK